MKLRTVVPSLASALSLIAFVYQPVVQDMFQVGWENTITAAPPIRFIVVVGSFGVFGFVGVLFSLPVVRDIKTARSNVEKHTQRRHKAERQIEKHNKAKLELKRRSLQSISALPEDSRLDILEVTQEALSKTAFILTKKICADSSATEHDIKRARTAFHISSEIANSTKAGAVVSQSDYRELDRMLHRREYDFEIRSDRPVELISPVQANNQIVKLMDTLKASKLENASPNEYIKEIEKIIEFGEAQGLQSVPETTALMLKLRWSRLSAFKTLYHRHSVALSETKRLIADTENANFKNGNAFLADCYALLSTFLSTPKKWEEANKALQYAISLLDPDQRAPFVTHQASILQKQNRLEEALDLLENAIFECKNEEASSEGLPLLRTWRATIQADLGQTIKALAEVDELIAKQLEDSEVLNVDLTVIRSTRVYILEKMGRTVEATAEREIAMTEAIDVWKMNDQ